MRSHFHNHHFAVFRHRSGFSLVEMLVTIGIIAVLAVLSMPTFGRVLEKGRAIKCTSNLKQWGSVVMAYVAENDGYLPCNDTGIWLADLWEYANPGTTKSVSLAAPNGVLPPNWKNTIYECPEAVKTDPKDKAIRCYGFNLRAGDAKTSTLDKLASIIKPASTAMIGENASSNDLGISSITARHKNRCNVVYMDGHVGNVEVTSALTSSYKDAFWGQTQYADQW